MDEFFKGLQIEFDQIRRAQEKERKQETKPAKRAPCGCKLTPARIQQIKDEVAAEETGSRRKY
ncbi:MAG: hypothetical protein WCF85_11270 [Rhodospirillaceae bacterium]